MTHLPSISAFLQSHAGRSFLVFAALCALLAATVGYGFYRVSLDWFLASAGQQKATALQLVDAFVATYSRVRNTHLTDAAPVPRRRSARMPWRSSQGHERATIRSA